MVNRVTMAKKEPVPINQHQGLGFMPVVTCLKEKGQPNSEIYGHYRHIDSSFQTKEGEVHRKPST